MRNRYLFILNSNSTGMKFLFELFNESDDPRYYKFTIQAPPEMTYGEYDWILVRCALEYELEFSHNLIDSRLKVTDDEGVTSSWILRDLSPETGLLEFRPDESRFQYDILDIDNSRVDVIVE